MEHMPRFLTLADVAEQLQINSPAAYALVRSGELKAIQVGGRGQWRVEETMLEQYIQERYAEASRMIEEAKSKSRALSLSAGCLAAANCPRRWQT